MTQKKCNYNFELKIVILHKMPFLRHGVLLLRFCINAKMSFQAQHAQKCRFRPAMLKSVISRAAASKLYAQ